MTILVPVRYPLDDRSRGTLEEAVDRAAAEDTRLVVLHVDLFQDPSGVARQDLEREASAHVDGVSATYVVRRGFLVEQAILEEAANRDADTIVIGETAVGRLRRAMRRLIGNDPDVEGYLREHLEIDIEVAD